MTKAQIIREIAKLSAEAWRKHEMDSPVMTDHADYLLDRICYLKLSIDLKPTKGEWAGRKRHNENVEALYQRAQKRTICEEQLFPGETLTVY